MILSLLMEWRGYVLSSLHNLIEGITWSTSSRPYYGGTKTCGGTSLLSYYEGKKRHEGGGHSFLLTYVVEMKERSLTTGSAMIILLAQIQVSMEDEMGVLELNPSR